MRMRSFRLCPRALREHLIEELAQSDSETFKEFIKTNYFINSPQLPDKVKKELDRLNRLCTLIWKLSNDDSEKFQSILEENKKGFARILDWLLYKIHFFTHILHDRYKINTQWIHDKTAESAMRMQFRDFLHVIINSQKYVHLEQKKLESKSLNL